MATMAAGTDLTASGVNVATKLTHFATKAEVVVEFAKVSAGGTDLSGVAIADFVTNVHANLDEDHTTALAKLDPTHMAVMAAGTDMSSGLQVADLSHFATKGELASVYVDAGGAGVDIASIVTTIHSTITVEFTTSLKEFDPTHMATMATGVDITAVTSVGHKAKVAHSYKTKGDDVASILSAIGNISATDLAIMGAQDLANLDKIATSTDLTKVHQDGAHIATIAHHGGDIDQAIALDPDQRQALAESDDVASTVSGGGSLTDAAESAHGSSQVKTAADAITGSYSGFQAALESSISVANLLLTNRTVSTDLDLADDITISNLATTGYTTELIRILAQYGALGSNGSALADAVLGSTYTAFDQSIGLDAFVNADTSYYQQFITDLGARALGPNKTGNSIFSVSTSNIKLSTGAEITFNAGATLDASEVLPAGDTRRIAMVGSAKDMIIKGDLTINNSNYTENGALVLGSADDIHFRSEYSSTSTTPEDYTGNPDVLKVTYFGTNAAIGSQDTMRLVNVSMTTGGNLAIGTLDELHIGTASAQNNSISVGTGGLNSDSDNVYMYAKNLIQVNGLDITGRVDDVYMEAITINLKNVNFPDSSEVTLRSRDGTIGFDFANPIVGGVNFTNVKHGTDVLSSTSFNQITTGHYATTKVQPNLTPAVQVKKF